ncbi:hypothetical protein ACFYKX_16380 [Cytobacillus sp. FJAT-54145]|uniref:SR1 protein n=1 Tax=Cytobacillus spartinae TaxID=3299023 RepID=A0ABW6KDD7_9BACI
MKEFVGHCFICKKELYCLEGFFDGVVAGEQLLCFTCSEGNEE